VAKLSAAGGNGFGEEPPVLAEFGGITTKIIYF